MPAKPNRHRQLRAFCYAAQSGSISKAASQLGLSQPSISLQIQALERELGVQVFERRGPRIQMTPAGEILLEIAQPLVDGIEHVGEAFRAKLGNADNGHLDIAAGESTLLYILPEVTKRFSDEFPHVTVRLHNVTGQDGMEKLRADEVEFAVGSMLDVPEDMLYYPIFNYTPTLITPPDHPLSALDNISLADIGAYGLILPPRHLATWRVVDLVFQQHDVPYRVHMEAGGWEVIKRYVAMNLGISIVTSICLQEDDALFTHPLSDYFPERSYGVVIRRGKFISPQAKCFLQTLKPNFEQLQASNSGSGTSSNTKLLSTSNKRRSQPIQTLEDDN